MVEDAGVNRTLRSGLFWVGLLVTAVFTYVAVRDVRLEEAWRAFKSTNYWWLLPSLAVMALFVVIRAIRWRCLFTPSGRPRLRPVTAALLIGYLFNNILPARAGEVARVVALNQRAGTPLAETSGTVVIERVYDVLCLLVLLFVALPWLPPVSWLSKAVSLAIVVAVVLAGAIAVLSVWGDRALRLMLRPFRRLVLMRGIGPRASPPSSARVSLDCATGASASWPSCGRWCRGSCSRSRSGSSCLRSTSVSRRVAGLFVVIGVGLAMILPASPASLGVFEAAVVLTLGAYGISDSRALPYALVLHAVNFFPYVLVGAVVLRRHAAIVRERARSLAPRPEM